MDTILIPMRSALEGVERIHFYEGGGRCPEDITFPSVMRTVMEYLGENLGCKHHRPLEKSWGLGCSYSYFMGVSGLAFALNWEPGWGKGTYDLMGNLPGAQRCSAAHSRRWGTAANISLPATARPPCARQSKPAYPCASVR